MSIHDHTAIDWDTYEPSAAVRKAAIMLSSADTVEAVCFGWVPQAREALAIALDVDEIAKVLAGFDSISWDRMKKYQKDIYRLMAEAVATAILGATS